MWLLLLLLARLAAGGDKVSITHYGGPDFVIDDGSTVIYVDPLPPNDPNFIRHFKAFRKTNSPVPDLVVITHSHNDHCSGPAIKELSRLNRNLRVIAPVDTHDTLDPILRPEQLLMPVPKPGKPVTIPHKHLKIHVYRTLHGWLTDDLLPYNYTFPFHYMYVIEAKGYRILVSGDSYDYREAAKEFDKLDAVLWHIYKPSDLFDFAALQRLFSPSYIIPYHLNIRYGLQQPEMAALTDRYRFQDVRAVYLTEAGNTLVLQKNPARDAAAPSAHSGQPVRFRLEIDRLFRGIQEPQTIQVLAGVRNQGPTTIQGEVALDAPEGWQIRALDPVSCPRLTSGRDFLCRFRVKAPPNIVLDGRREYAIKGRFGGASEEIRLGAGNIYHWNILGPFDNADGEGDERSYPPEEKPDLRGTYAGRNSAPIRWVPYASRDLQTGYVDMSGMFDIRETYAPMPAAANPRYARTQEQLVGYALSYIDSPSDREAVLNAGAPYGLRIFLNSRSVFEMPGYDFNFHTGQFQIPVRLKKGRNMLLVKIARGKLPENNLSPWTGFCVRVTGPDRQPFRDLSFSME